MLTAQLGQLLDRVGLSMEDWKLMVSKLTRLFPRLVGSVHAIRERAKHAGKMWFHGSSNAPLLNSDNL
jgi:hypothetical protein